MKKWENGTIIWVEFAVYDFFVYLCAILYVHRVTPEVLQV